MLIITYHILISRVKPNKRCKTTIEKVGHIKPKAIKRHKFNRYNKLLKSFFHKYFHIIDKKLKFTYCILNQVRNFSIETDSTTIGIELCKIPQISLHCP